MPSENSKFRACNEGEIECHNCKEKFFIFSHVMADGDNIALICVEEECRSMEIVDIKTRWGFRVRISRKIREKLLAGINESSF